MSLHFGYLYFLNVFDVHLGDRAVERERHFVVVVQGNGRTQAGANVSTVVSGKQEKCADGNLPLGDYQILVILLGSASYRRSELGFGAALSPRLPNQRTH
jgi:hypothetical protein